MSKESLTGTERFLEERYDRIEDEIKTEEEYRLVRIIRGIVREELTHTMPSEEERKWVQQAMISSAKRTNFWNTVVESSAKGVILAFFAAVGYAILEYAKIKLASAHAALAFIGFLSPRKEGDDK